jgi:hypothetical protein
MRKSMLRRSHARTGLAALLASLRARRTRLSAVPEQASSTRWPHGPAELEAGARSRI